MTTTRIRDEKFLGPVQMATVSGGAAVLAAFPDTETLALLSAADPPAATVKVTVPGLLGVATDSTYAYVVTKTGIERRALPGLAVLTTVAIEGLTGPVAVSGAGRLFVAVEDGTIRVYAASTLIYLYWSSLCIGPVMALAAGATNVYAVDSVGSLETAVPYEPGALSQWRLRLLNTVLINGLTNIRDFHREVANILTVVTTGRDEGGAVLGIPLDGDGVPTTPTTINMTQAASEITGADGYGRVSSTLPQTPDTIPELPFWYPSRTVRNTVTGLDDRAIVA